MRIRYKHFVCLLAAAIIFLAFPRITRADDYDGILLTRYQEKAQERSDELSYSASLPPSLDQLYGVWIAPDGGKWYFENNGYMGSAGRHMGCAYTLNNDTLTWSGPTGTEVYSIKFAANYNQIFFYNPGSEECVLCLDRLTQITGGTNDLFYSGGGMPWGGLDEVGIGAGVLYTGGWTYDPDTPSASCEFYVTIGGVQGIGQLYGPYTADLVRDDINNKYGSGRYHGLAAAVYTDLSGNQDVYVYTTNYPSGELTLLGHAQVYIPSRILPADTSQIGSIETPDDPVAEAASYPDEEEEKKETDLSEVETVNIFSEEEASSIMHGYCYVELADKNGFIFDEYTEGEHIYVICWRLSSGFIQQYRVDLTTGEVRVTDTYNGEAADADLIDSAEYAFNLSDYIRYLYFDEFNSEDRDIKIDNTH